MTSPSPSWQEEYLTSLEERDTMEMANHSIYQAYTALADRTAVAQTTAPTASTTAATTSSATTTAATAALPPSATDSHLHLPDALPLLRADLSRAQRSRQDLESRLESLDAEITTLKSRAVAESRRITDLTAEKSSLTVRLRDRDEELRGKSKLLDNVQDELVSLNLQLNMSDDRNRNLRKENQELVDRWMARMGREAERMNEESKFS